MILSHFVLTVKVTLFLVSQIKKPKLDDIFNYQCHQNKVNLPQTQFVFHITFGISKLSFSPLASFLAHAAPRN